MRITREPWELFPITMPLERRIFNCCRYDLYDLTAKVKDIRVREYHSIDSNKEYPVYTYLQEERETHCSYVAEEDKWIIDTTVGKHITKLMKIRNADITIESVTESVIITATN